MILLTPSLIGLLCSLQLELIQLVITIREMSLDATIQLMEFEIYMQVIVIEANAAFSTFAQVDINILIPTVIGKHVRLHPMVVIIGVIIGINVGGVLGVVLAAPTIASLRVIGRYIYAKLFRMYPFPMTGPPSTPWKERLALLLLMQETEGQQEA